MTLRQAIITKADILCSSLEERNRCIAILHADFCFHKGPLFNERLVLNILSAKRFNCGTMICGGVYPTITGADFIKSNTKVYTQ